MKINRKVIAAGIGGIAAAIAIGVFVFTLRGVILQA